jgi:hypothetical protein
MRICLFILISLLCGCATQGANTSQYTPGNRTKIDNETTVDGSSSRVWDVLVRDLAKSFYVINNIDKESRIINVSFTSTEPADFVDCGRTVRTFTEGSNVERYEYDVAGKATFKVAANKQEHPAFSNYAVWSRSPTLEGRSNVYLAPAAGDAGKTTVSVNTRYVLNVRLKGDAFAKHISGGVQGRGRLPEDTATFTFNTNTVGTGDSANGVVVTCFSKGKLEKEILQMVQAK